MAQWTTRLTTNQKIAGSSPARIEITFSGTKRYHRTKSMGASGKVTGLTLYQRSCGAMDNASDYESEDCRFDACQDRQFLFLGPIGSIGQSQWESEAR